MKFQTLSLGGPEVASWLQEKLPGAACPSPFDDMNITTDGIVHALGDNFQEFLNRERYVPDGRGGTAHLLYDNDLEDKALFPVDVRNSSDRTPYRDRVLRLERARHSPVLLFVRVERLITERLAVLNYRRLCEAVRKYVKKINETTKVSLLFIAYRAGPTKACAPLKETFGGAKGCPGLYKLEIPFRLGLRVSHGLRATWLLDQFQQFQQKEE